MFAFSGNSSMGKFASSVIQRFIRLTGTLFWLRCLYYLDEWSFNDKVMRVGFWYGLYLIKYFPFLPATDFLIFFPVFEILSKIKVILFIQKILCDFLSIFIIYNRLSSHFDSESEQRRKILNNVRFFLFTDLLLLLLFNFFPYLF